MHPFRVSSLLTMSLSGREGETDRQNMTDRQTDRQTASERERERERERVRVRE